MNRHGISQNPTAAESALLRKLWRADAAKAAARRARQNADDLATENERLRAENERLRALIKSSSPEAEG